MSAHFAMSPDWITFRSVAMSLESRCIRAGALFYLPFLTGPPPVSPPFTGLLSAVDMVVDHTGQLCRSVMKPEPLGMLAADIGSLHGRFMTIDENRGKIFALTASGYSMLQLSQVPLGILTLTPAVGAVAGLSNVTAVF
jgi:hypothetical protein